MIYTLIIFSIVIGLLLYCFRIQILRRNYNISALNIQIKINEYDKDRTYLLTKLNKYIKEKSEIINKDNIDNVLLNINNSKIDSGKSFIEYKSGYIILKLHKKDDKFRKEYYKYTLKGEEHPKISFNILKINE